MNIIDFDGKFKLYIKEWMKDNLRKYQNVEDMEEEIPELYLKWVKTPQKWLKNISPLEYFDSILCPDILIEMLVKYVNSDYNVPDLLLDRIADMGSACEDRLMQVVCDENNVKELRIISASLLVEVSTEKSLKQYINLIEQQQGEGQLVDYAAGALINLGELVKEPILEAIQHTTVAAVKMVFIDILSNFKGDKRIYNLLVNAFLSSPDNKMVYASYLAKYGDKDALNILEKVIREPDISYLD
ncbi:MAG: hypothetical protein PHP06_05685, partial [Clostridia bacterium]|nr:hypothetical protein [Clostridia bacterium]